MQQVSRVTVLMSRACLYSFFDELYDEALNAPLCPSPSRQSDHDLTSTEVVYSAMVPENSRQELVWSVLFVERWI